MCRMENWRRTQFSSGVRALEQWRRSGVVNELNRWKPLAVALVCSDMVFALLFDLILHHFFVLCASNRKLFRWLYTVVGT